MYVLTWLFDDCLKHIHCNVRLL